MTDYTKEELTAADIETQLNRSTEYILMDNAIADCKSCGNPPLTFLRGSRFLEASVWCGRCELPMVCIKCFSRSFAEISRAIKKAIYDWNELQLSRSEEEKLTEEHGREEGNRAR